MWKKRKEQSEEPLMVDAEKLAKEIQNLVSRLQVEEAIVMLAREMKNK